MQIYVTMLTSSKKLIFLFLMPLLTMANRNCNECGGVKRYKQSSLNPNKVSSNNKKGENRRYDPSQKHNIGTLSSKKNSKAVIQKTNNNCQAHTAQTNNNDYDQKNQKVMYKEDNHKEYTNIRDINNELKNKNDNKPTGTKKIEAGLKKLKKFLSGVAQTIVGSKHGDKNKTKHI